jgi:hypothetical protein
MGAKPVLEKERVREDIVCNGDGISGEVHEPRGQLAIHLTPDPYSDITDVVSDAWSVNHKERQGLTELIAKPFIRRAK